MKDKTIITVVLTFAVTALIAVGIISFTNYQSDKFKTEIEAKQAASPETSPGSSGSPISAPAPAVATPTMSRPVAPAASPAAAPPTVAGTESEKFAQMQAEYDKIQALKDREAAMMAEIQNARNGGGLASAPAPSTPSLATDQTILGSGPTGVGPELASTLPTSQPLTRFQQEIKNEAAIAKVTHYDEGLNFLVMDGGQDRNIEPGQKFAVRSGVDIVGYVRVEEVTLNESIAKLVSKNKDSVTARKPQLGDELISYDRFAF